MKRSVLIVFAALCCLAARAQGPVVTVVNNTGYDINYLYVSDNSSDSWGNDVLGRSVIRKGGEFRVTLPEEGTFDFKATDEDDDDYTKWNIMVRGGAVRVIFTADDLGSSPDRGYDSPYITTSRPASGSVYVDITNDTGDDIYWLYISRGEDNDWFEDILGDGIFHEGDRIRVVLPNAGEWDFRGKSSDDENYYKYDVPMSRGANTVVFETSDYDEAEEDEERGYDAPYMTTSQPASGSTYVNITNDTGEDIYYLYISKSSDSGWFEDILGDSFIFEAGQRIRVVLPGADEWDFKAEDSDENSFTRMHQDMGRGANSLVFDSSDDGGEERGEPAPYIVTGRAPSGSAYVDITNNTGETIYWLYISRDDDSGWFDDILGDEVLAAGDRIRVVLPGPGDWDFRAQNSDEENFYRWTLAMSAGANTVAFEHSDSSDAAAERNEPAPYIVSSTPGADLTWVTIENATDEDIHALYISRDDDTDWFDDILGDEVLGAGGRIRVVLPGPGEWDFRSGDRQDNYYYKNALPMREGSNRVVIGAADAD